MWGGVLRFADFLRAGLLLVFASFEGLVLVLDLLDNDELRGLIGGFFFGDFDFYINLDLKMDLVEFHIFSI